MTGLSSRVDRACADLDRVPAQVWQGLACIVVTAAFGVAAFETSLVVDGTRYFWLDDDQMISMRYARNLAEGHGLVWNAGERVEGYTNFGWTLVMAGVHLLQVSDAKAALFVKGINLLLACLVLLLSGRILRLLGGRSGFALGVSLIVLALCVDLLYWAVNGFETTLLTVVFLFLIARILRESDQGRMHASTALLIGTLPLIRGDAFHVWVAVVVLALGLTVARAHAVRYVALALLVPVCHLVFRFVYYGDLLPNTYYLKVAEIDGLTLKGLGYLKGFVHHYSVVLILAVLGSFLVSDRRLKWLLAGLATAAVHVMMVGSDMFALWRFLAHLVPLLVVMAVVNTETIFQRRAARALVLVSVLAGRDPPRRQQLTRI